MPKMESLLHPLLYDQMPYELEVDEMSANSVNVYPRLAVNVVD